MCSARPEVHMPSVTQPNRKSSTTKKNARFAAMTAPQKRVAIMKDVLKYIRGEQLSAKRGTWVKSKRGRKLLTGTDFKGNVEIKEALDQKAAKGVQCDVCMIGACIYSTIRRFNEVKIEDAFLSTSHYYERHGTDQLQLGSFEEYLRKFFAAKQLALMEFTFEAGSGGMGYDSVSFDMRKRVTKFLKPYLEEIPGLSYRDASDIHRYRLRQDSAREVMVKICKNVIANNGTFKP